MGHVKKEEGSSYIPPFSKKVRPPFVIKQSISEDFLLHPCYFI